jgi:hypothetical protein
MLHFHQKLYVLHTWKWSSCGIIQHIPIIANSHNHQYISRHIPCPLKFTYFCTANSTHHHVLGLFKTLLTIALLGSTMGMFTPSRQLCQISTNAGKPYTGAIYQPPGLHHMGRARTLTHPSESKLIMQIQSCYRKRLFCDSLYTPCQIFTYTNTTASGTGTEFC